MKVHQLASRGMERKRVNTERNAEMEDQEQVSFISLVLEHWV